MKEIQLTQEKVALVDDEDYNEVIKHSWYAHKVKGIWYARSRLKEKYGGDLLHLHRFIMKAPSNKVVDHEDHNGLNNQKYNLRVCTQAQNCQNQSPQTGRTSKYKGVGWRKDTSIWRAYIKKDQTTVNLGCFEYEEQAALIYNLAAIKYFGAYAYLNKLPAFFEKQFKEVIEILAQEKESNFHRFYEEI